MILQKLPLLCSMEFETKWATLNNICHLRCIFPLVSDLKKTLPLWFRQSQYYHTVAVNSAKLFSSSKKKEDGQRPMAVLSFSRCSSYVLHQLIQPCAYTLVLLGGPGQGFITHRANAADLQPLNNTPANTQFVSVSPNINICFTEKWNLLRCSKGWCGEKCIASNATFTDSLS